VTSLPEDIKFPPTASEKLLREIVGEGVPPLLSKAFLEMLTKESEE
jgi:site-specific DNA-cytosine methylase